MTKIIRLKLYKAIPLSNFHTLETTFEEGRNCEKIKVEDTGLVRISFRDHDKLVGTPNIEFIHVEKESLGKQDKKPKAV